MNDIELPHPYRHWIGRLSSAAWRERKEASAALLEQVERDREHPGRLADVADVLLDVLASPEALTERASCHEVLVGIGTTAIDPLLRRIAIPGASQRLLVDLLAEIGKPAHARYLHAIVVDPHADPNLRASAASALGRLGGQDAASILVGLLRDPSEMLRMHALDALRRASARVEVGELRELVAQRFTRKAAAAVLGHSASVEAVDLLVPLLDDKTSSVRAVAARSLVLLEADLEPMGRSEVVHRALRRASGETLGRVRELLAHELIEVQAAAIALCGMASDSEMVPLCLEVMDDPLLHEQVLRMVGRLGADAPLAVARAGDGVGGRAREHLVRIIGAIQGEVGAELVALLIGALGDAYAEAAVAAAEVLARVGDRSCLAELFRAMGKPGVLGAAAGDAIVALVQHSGETTDLDLIVGSVWPQTGDLAANLCRVVGELKSDRHAPQLVAMLGSPDVQVRVAAAIALGKVGGGHGGVSGLSFALADEEPEVRAATCRSLGWLAAPESLQPLIGATHDPAPSVRAAAVQALVALDRPTAWPRLRSIIAEESVFTVVVQAIAGLGSSELDEDLHRLMALCSSPEWEVVKAAARALARFRQHRATAALLGLLDHERWDVRWIAAEVLGERRDATALVPLRRAVVEERDESVQNVLRRSIQALERAL